MALSSSKGASLLTAALAPAAYLTPDGTPIGGVDYTIDTSGFPDGFAKGYDTYAMDGVLVGAISDGGDWSIIANYLRSGATNEETFGLTLARYWATANVTPAGGFSSVSNDAMSFVSLFVAAIRASKTETLSHPPYKQFLENVENIALSAVTWTAIKIAVPPVPITSKIV